MGTQSSLKQWPQAERGWPSKVRQGCPRWGKKFLEALPTPHCPAPRS